MSLTVTRDNVSKILATIQKLAGQEVLVGIPATKAERNDDEPGEPMNNAQLGYVHEYGSPAANIPARPFLEPGVADKRAAITGQLRKAAGAAMDGNEAQLQAALNAAGLTAASGAKSRINSGDFAPLSPSTVRNRRKSRGTKSMRAAEKKYLELVAQGSTPAQAQEEAGIKPLINTGQLRNAITYVIRKKE